MKIVKMKVGFFIVCIWYWVYPGALTELYIGYDSTPPPPPPRRFGRLRAFFISLQLQKFFFSVHVNLYTHIIILKFYFLPVDFLLSMFCNFSKQIICKYFLMLLTFYSTISSVWHSLECHDFLKINPHYLTLPFFLW